MSAVGQIERKTQDRVVKLFAERLGYEYLGSWEDREGNSHIEESLLRQNLLARGYDDVLVSRAINELLKVAGLGGAKTLYEANRAVYDLLRYGVKVKRGVADQFETVWLIDWEHPEANHFVVVEEVSVAGKHNKRPDVVLYVNGLALGVIGLFGSMRGWASRVGSRRRPAGCVVGSGRRCGSRGPGAGSSR